MYRVVLLLCLTSCLILLVVVACSREAPADTLDESPQLLADEPTRFAVIGDYGTQSAAAAEVAALIASWDVDFVATLGDNNYDFGEASTIDANIGQYYQQFIKPYGGSYGPGSPDINRFWPALGNHDWDALSCDASGCSGPYFDYFELPNNERYYDVQIGPVHLFILDSDDSEPDGITSTSVQAQWLAARLGASSAPHKIVLLHHAPYSSGVVHGSDPGLQWPFEAWGATAVMSAHDHIYERLQVDAIPYFVNGAGGKTLHRVDTPIAESQVHYDTGWGAMLVSAQDDQITYQFINRAGTIIDTHVQIVDDGTTPTTLTRQIAASSDDAEERSTGAISLTSSDLELTDDLHQGLPNQTVGLRFTNVTVPKNATILDAHIEFTVDEPYWETTDLTIRGEASDNPATFGTSSGNISGRSTTAASVAWPNVAPWPTVGETQLTPSLRGLVQELVDQSGWQSGNALAFIITGTGRRTAESYNGSRTGAPRLVVSYSSSGPGNQAPVANDGSFSTTKNNAVAITLEASDADGDALTYTVVDAPTQGVLSGEAPQLSYTPDTDYVGTDSFSFKVNDGLRDSNTATVTIEVQPTGAESFSLTRQISAGSDDAEERENGTISLSSSDLELTDDLHQGLPNQTVGLRFTDITIPQGATILDAYLEFTVDEAYSQATDLQIAAQASDDATTFANTPGDIISRAVTRANVSWTKVPAWPSVGATHPSPDIATVVQEVIDRSGWQSGNALAFIITGTGRRTAESYNGSRSGAPRLVVAYSTDSPPPGNTAPSLSNPGDQTNTEGEAVSLQLVATDADGDALSYSASGLPAGLSLDASTGLFAGTLAAGSAGSYAVNVGVADDAGGSDSAVFTWVVNEAVSNRAPTAQAQSLSVNQNGAVDIVLGANDPDGDALSYSIIETPQHGTLTGTAPNLNYSPDADYSGTDSFSFRVSDGELDSNLATVDISVMSIGGSSTLSRRIAASSDDAEERENGTISLGSSDLELTDDLHQGLPNQMIGLRFTNITIPQGATILEARIEFTVDEAHYETTRLQIAAQASDNAASFTNTSGNISSRPVTTARADWMDIPVWTVVGETHSTPHLATVVQDVVNRSGWQSGNALAFIITGTGRRTVESYNGSASSAPELVLTYSTGSGPINRAPVANDAGVTTNENTTVAVTLTASDADGDALTYEIISPPQHGTLAGNTPDLTYTPDTDFDGLDSFGFRANDGSEDSNTATVTIEVTRENANAPVAQDAALTTFENMAVDVTLEASDADGDPLSFQVLTQPGFGTLSGDPPDLTYTPDAGYLGEDSFTFQASDGERVSNVATIALVTERPNTPPTAEPQSLTLYEDAALNIIPGGNDADGDTLGFEVTTLPQYGTLTRQTISNGDGSTYDRVIYKPHLRYRGPDSFTFVVNDGLVDSAPATIDLSVLQVAQPPNGGLGDHSYRPTDTMLHSDDKLRFLIITDSHQQANRTREIDQATDLMIGRMNTWLPNGFIHAGDLGHTDDKIENVIKATDHYEQIRRPVMIAIGNHDVLGQDMNNIGELEQIPMLGQFPFWRYQLHASGDGSFSALLVHMDDNYFSDTTLPGRAPPYMQDGDYYGDPVDYNGSFFEWKRQFTQPQLDWLEAVLADNPTDLVIVVHHHPDTLIADYKDMADILREDGRHVMAINGHTHQSAELRTKYHRFLAIPTFNMMGMRETGAWAELVIGKTPTGIDPVIKIDNFGSIDNWNVDKITAVAPVVFKSSPVATPQDLSLAEDSTLDLTLTAEDTDGDTLSYAIVEPTRFGTLTGDPPHLSYTPQADYSGTDSFTFSASDEESSSTATVSLTITPVNDAPSVEDQALTSLVNQPVSITLTAMDVDSSVLRYTVTQQPVNGTLSDTAPDLTYTPNPGFVGTDSFKYTASDDEGATSSEASVTLTLTNTPPVAIDGSFTIAENSTLELTLEASDPDAQPLIYQIIDSPQHGSLTGNAPDLMYMPNAGYSGEDSFTFSVSDGTVDSNLATITIEVERMNANAPVANDAALTTPENTSVGTTLVISDADGDTITYQVVDAPTNGTLSGDAPELIYTLNTGYSGTDGFTFTASDGLEVSSPASITIEMEAN